MKRQWIRKYSVFINNFPSEVVIDDLRIIFKIIKTRQISSNKCNLKIYNLKPETRAIFEGEDVRLTLEAGYQDESGLIFKGNVKRSSFKKVGPDWITDILIADGDKALREVNFQKSYVAGIDIKNVISDIVDKMKSEGRVISKSLKNISSEILQKGLSVTGIAEEILDKLIDKQGLEVHIQNEEIVFVDPKGDIGRPEINITPETGLIGSPIRREKNGIQFESLINHNMIPGSLINLKSKDINGLFVIRKQSIQGDSQGNPWFMKSEGIPR